MKTRTLVQTNITNSQHRSDARASAQRHGRWPTKWLMALFVGAVALAATPARASDPIAVFARIDKVVAEPNNDSPERIQVWGSFSVADPKDRYSYLPPQKGYLFYRLPTEKPEVARKEWNDLKTAAGSGDVIGFGSRHSAHPKVRSAQDKPMNPDTYSVGFGLVKSSQRSSEYPPIKALLAEGKKTAGGKTPGKGAE